MYSAALELSKVRIVIIILWQKILKQLLNEKYEMLHLKLEAFQYHFKHDSRYFYVFSCIRMKQNWNRNKNSCTGNFKQNIEWIYTFAKINIQQQ